MRNIFHALIISVVASTVYVSSSFAALSSTSEVACSNYGADAVSCNQCFDGGTDYVGDAIAKNFSDIFVNTSSSDLIIARNGGLSAGPVTLQSAVSVGLSSDYGVSFPASIFWFTESGQDVALLFAGTSTPIAQMNGGVLLTAVSAGANASRPAFRFDYTTSVRSYDFVSRAIGVSSVHRECAFVSPRWCGDGIVSNGEVCDAGATNGQAGQCNSSCTGTVPIVTTCNSITVTPVSGTAPLDVSVSCNATNASTYRIDCGNGTTHLSSAGVCRYVAGGTYAPVCTVNGSITSPSCTMSITVNPPPPTPVCSSTITGPVDFPLSSVTPGLCSIGSVNPFGATVVGSTTNYSWSCNNAGQAVSCSANYTPIPVPADLALKKYVNTVDAQDNATAVSIQSGNNYVYTVTVQNIGAGMLIASRTTLSDPLPAGVTLTGLPSGIGWTCSGAIGATSFSCDRNDGLASGAFFPTITIPVRVVSQPTYLTNTATVSNANDPSTSNNTDPAVIIVTTPPVGGVCSTTITGTQSSPITAGACNVGSPIGFAVTGTTTLNYSWSCSGINGGATSPACTANYTPPVVVTPSCNSISISPTSGTTPLNSSVSCNTTNATSVSIACGNGQVINNSNGICNYTTIGTFAPRCTVNGSITNTACTASVTTTPPVTTPPVCNPAKTGVQSTPVSSTDTLCSIGTVSGFTAIGSNPINYTWSCNDTTSIACTANYTPPVASTPSLSIKKYVKTLGAAGDTQSAPISVALGETFNYYYQLQNTGSVAATGVIVKDTLPAYLTFTGSIVITNPAGTDVTSDWTCVKGSPIFSGETIARITLVCSKKTDLPANSGLYTFTVPVVLATNAPIGVNMQNVVYACAANSSANPTGPSGQTICGDINPPPPPPPGQCDPITPNNQKDPACIVVGGTGFDLSLKKYIGTNDAQPGAPLSTSNGAALSYSIRVTNLGPTVSSGTTTVQDILPAGVVLDGALTGSSWTCSSTGATIRCMSTLVVASGASYPDIIVPFRVTATAGQTITNIAAVNNPNEINRCNADGSLPATDSTSCTLDPKNSDPAVFTISGGGTGGGTSHVGPKCVNSIKSCATYNSLIACEAEVGVGNCDSSDAPGQTRCAAKVLTCSGPGGPGGGGGGGRCGDGVLQVGEECDVVGAPWCVSCQIDLTTTPGANSITDLWMTIPVLAGTQRLGYTWLDGTPGKVAFADHRMVLGVGTKAFTLADSVGFGIKTRFRIPLMIEADKKICLKSEGTSLNSENICTTFGEGAPFSMIWTRPIDGKRYVVIGQGDFQYQNTLAGPYYVNSVNHSNDITLFKGATQYRPGLAATTVGPTLNSAFFGRVTGNDGTIGLFTDTGVDLVKLPVRVSGAVVSSVGSSSNRAIEIFINTRDVFRDFLGTTIGYTSTTNSNTVGTTTRPIPLPVLTGGSAGTISSVADIERYAVNGNHNILAVNGDLTITCPAGSTVFTMTGVRTVIVTGNLIIRCNIGYGSSDSSSSWAWIAKNGNIQVSNGAGTTSVGAVTNLAGVYVAVKDASSTTGGDITYTGNNTTQAILRVEGTLYGNASPLFSSRLYARATGAYDILTTGTILTYSNRALVSPPPLLSQYLGSYQVQRVVQ